MNDHRDALAEQPVTEDIGLPIPHSPGRLPPPHLSRAPPTKDDTDERVYEATAIAA